MTAHAYAAIAFRRELRTTRHQALKFMHLAQLPQVPLSVVAKRRSSTALQKAAVNHAGGTNVISLSGTSDDAFQTVDGSRHPVISLA